jgi:hypothetical protein
MELLIILGWIFLLLSVCSVLSIVLISDKFELKPVLVCALLAIISIGMIAYGDYKYPEFALTHGERLTEFAQIRSVNPKTIILDNATFYQSDNAVSKAYPINFDNFKVGEIVKYDYLQVSSRTYLIQIEKYTGQ